MGEAMANKFPNMRDNGWVIFLHLRFDCRENITELAYQTEDARPNVLPLAKLQTRNVGLLVSLCLFGSQDSKKAETERIFFSNASV